MGEKLIEGLKIKKLSIIEDDRGSLMHMLRNDDELFTTFGECYFSEVFPEKIKGWKCHTSQTQNLAVPVGKVKFIIFDNRVNSNTKGKLEEVTLGRLKNYKRLKIPPGLWYSFKCISKNKALIVNCSDKKHDPNESLHLDLNNSEIPYNW